MIGSRIRWAPEPGEVELQAAAFRSNELQIGTVKTLGLQTLDIGGRAAPSRKTWVWLVLEGEARFRRGDREQILRRGEVSTFQGASGLVGTSRGVELLALNISGATSLRVEGRLDRPDFMEALELTTRLRELAGPTGDIGGERRGLARRLSALLTVPAPLRLSLSASSDQSLARLVMRICEAWVRHPGLDDFSAALGLSIGRTSQVLKRYFSLYHSSFDGWRSYLSTMRTELAFGLLDARRTSARATAEWLGYRTSTSMYHALERRGLKPPCPPRRGSTPRPRAAETSG